MSSLLSGVTLLEGWFPPSRENWELLVKIFAWFPIVTTYQWFTDFYPQGKTAIASRFNLPGHIAWAIMETPGFAVLLYTMFTLPAKLGLKELPIGNWTMAGLYTLHYLYRAWLAPLVLNPSMSPIHPFVFISASVFNTINGLQLGGWLAGYGPTTTWEWTGRIIQINLGLIFWAWGWLANMYHDDELREIRREGMRRQAKRARDQKHTAELDKKAGKIGDAVKDKDNEAPNVDMRVTDGRIYMMPKGALFRLVLYPHYLCEWFEWFGFWMIGGWDCVPARSFLINEITTMTPRAVGGRRWYVKMFGEEQVGSRKAVIPGLL